MKSTHTYALLPVSPPAYNEIARLLVEAGYAHAFVGLDEGRPVVDMHGVALVPNMELKPGETYLEVRSLLSGRDHEGKVTIRLNDAVTQMDIRKAREVRDMLSEAIEAAASDQILYTFMREHIQLDEAKASNVLNEFRAIRHGSVHTVIPFVIKFSGINPENGRRMLGIGITAGNVAKLKEGHPIHFSAEQMTLPKIEAEEVLIFYGETEQAIYNTLKAAGYLEGTRIIEERGRKPS